MSDKSSTALHHNFTVPFVDQITQFNDYALPVAKEKGITVGNDDLVIVWIGINDIGDTAKFNFSTTSFKTFPALYEKIISIEFEALETVWEADYVNYLFMNLPPLQLTVSLTNLICLTAFNVFVNYEMDHSTLNDEVDMEQEAWLTLPSL